MLHMKTEAELVSETSQLSELDILNCRHAAAPSDARMDFGPHWDNRVCQCCAVLSRQGPSELPFKNSYQMSTMIHSFRISPELEQTRGPSS